MFLQSIIIELIIASLMATVMQVLGVRFDDGGNFDLDGFDIENRHFFPQTFYSNFSVFSYLQKSLGDES